MLVERAAILGQIDDVLTQSARGSGGIAAISGSTAMGKTTVLNAVAERAAEAGSTVLGIVGSPYERDVPFSALAQLLHAIDARFPGAGAPAHGAPPAARQDGSSAAGGFEEPDDATAHAPETMAAALVSPEAADDPLAVARQTYRLIARLAAGRHLLITVDDIQHADTATLTCLGYLAQRLSRHSVTLVYTCGASLDERPPRLLRDLLYLTGVRRLHLGPLTREDIARLVDQQASFLPADAPGDPFVTEIHTLSGGNPLLAQALIDEHASRLAPRPPASGTGCPEGELPTGHVFHQAVLAYLHRLGPRAVRLARCIALLDEAATPLLLSRLSGIDAELVERCLRTYGGAGLLDGAAVRLPGVRQAILGDMPHEELTALRHRAARLLHDGGAPPRAVAAHLLNAGPLREDWVASVLRDSARQALADGDVPLGVRCLELARECCTDEAQRLAVKAEYAAAQWQLRPADSAPHFLALKQPAVTGALPRAEALRAAEGMLFHLRFDDAVDVIDHLGDGPADETLASALRGTRLLMASEFPGVLHRPVRPLPPVTAAATSTSELRARHALALVLERGADAYAVALAEQVLKGSATGSRGSLRAAPTALLALCYADRLETAAEWYASLGTEAADRDAPAWRAQLACVGALLALRRGRLADAVRRAERAREQFAGPAWNAQGALALAVLVEAHTAMGDHRAAAGYLAPEPPPGLFLTRAGLHYLYARGHHHLATGNAYLALSDFVGCGALMRRWNIDTPALAPWRLGEAEALLRLGDRDRAARLVEQQLATPDTGLTRARGMALHGLARVTSTAKQPAILRDAFRLLESSGAQYEAAAVLADLSRAYQRLGEKTKARPTARRAWRLAKSCQAEAMCQSLLPSPASPAQSADPRRHAAPRAARRTAHDGFGGLSASERRVAMLASQGYANREIADRLFITVSTVEQHLTRVYRKMGIRNREQLLEGAQAVSYEPV
uniref:HerH n=1 Tax=Streptomyces marincola TaxID=2878388 RepID=A0A0U1ZVP3_9ACTN|nr:HerH [Streptomyces marincola]